MSQERRWLHGDPEPAVARREPLRWMWPSRRPGVGRVPQVGSGRAASVSGRLPAGTTKAASRHGLGSKLPRSAACSSSGSSGTGFATIAAVVPTRRRVHARASFACPACRFQGDPDRAGPQSRVPHRPAVCTDTGAFLSAGEVWRAAGPDPPGGHRAPAGSTPPRSGAIVRPLRQDRLDGLIHDCKSQEVAVFSAPTRSVVAVDVRAVKARAPPRCDLRGK
jgi:hypothetical protein